MKNKAFEKLVQKSLTKGKYKYSEASKRDVFGVLRTYKGLAPQFDTFVFDDGNERILLNVNGTIPIVYKGGTYNIPMCFWLLIDYPVAAPMAFVKPTLDMQIKASSNVDHTGKIDLPYLSDWKHPDSNLLDLIQLCILVFSQSPPVFSKAGRPTMSQQASISSLSSLQQQHSSSSNSQPTSRQASVQEREEEQVISAEEVRVSLISAAEQLVRDKLEEEFMKTKAEVQSLHSTNRELLDGQERIGEILTTLEAQELELGSHVAEVARKEDELRKVLHELSEVDLDSLSVDQIVMVPNPLQNQILDAFALDSAIDDAIYSLGKALHQGTVECDVYLKKVRDLSRRQFLQRVVVHKCKQRSGLERSWSASSNP